MLADYPLKTGTRFAVYFDSTKEIDQNDIPEIFEK